MTDPGDNLEFRPSEYYQEAVKEAPALAASVEAEIRNRPNAGITVVGIVKELLVETAHGKYLVFYSRRGNDIGLISAFYADDLTVIEEKRAELLVLFGRRGKNEGKTGASQ